MVKRVRLSESSAKVLNLKIDKISLSTIEGRANAGKKGRGRSVDYQIMSCEKQAVSNLLSDFNLMKKELKRHGVKVKHALHVSETEEYKKAMRKPLRDKDVPAFLRKDRK